MRIIAGTRMRRALRLCLFLAVVSPAMVFADGTETLGSTPVLPGSGVVAGSASLVHEPGLLTVEVPAGAAVQQALLYWTGGSYLGNPPDDALVVNGVEVVGKLIGGPLLIENLVELYTYRSDITDLGLVTAGINELTITGATFQWRSYGAGILVVYDDGTASAIELRDGLDFADPSGTPPRDTTAPQTFYFESDSRDRGAQLVLLNSRNFNAIPNTILVTVNGVTEAITDVIPDGEYYSTVMMPVLVPPEATSLTVEVIVETGPFTTCLGWNAAALVLPHVPLVDTACETAYAYAPPPEGTCFLEIPEIKNNRWGWTIGPLAAGSYAYEIYAGAGQCDITQGKAVGLLLVDYDGSTATVKYVMTEVDPTTHVGYSMDVAHLYVGNDMLPVDKKGRPRVAPGKYPYDSGDITGAIGHTFTVEGLSGNIYVVAHTDVSGFPASE
jgi:hypothetical protein